jgi:antitoxin MazE
MDDVYPEAQRMRVSKWGNSLAVRLPAALVEELKLKEGDQIELVARGKRKMEISSDERRRQAIEGMRKLAVPLPPGYKFDREEANARGPRVVKDETKTGTAGD